MTSRLSVEQMRQQSKRGFHAEVQVKYLKTSRSEKVNILDEFRILKHGYKHCPSSRKPNIPPHPNPRERGNGE